MTPTSEDQAVADWLRKLKWALTRMPSPEREDIVAETRAHLEERVAAGVTPAEAIAAFGPADVYARTFLDEMDVAVALGSRRLGDILAVVVRRLNRSLIAAAAFLVVLFVGGVALGLIVAAIWKIFDPAHVGVWIEGRSFWIGNIDDPAAGRELVGLWLYPIAAAGVTTAWLVCRAVLLWTVRALAPQR
jgi:hypothetical protein